MKTRVKTTVAVVGFLLIASAPASSQDRGHDYIGGLNELFFMRQPSARAEAMGKSIAATDAGAFGSFYNPANIGLSRGLNVNAAHAGPMYLLDKAAYQFAGAVAQIGRLGAVGFSYYDFSFGETYKTQFSDGSVRSFEPSTALYTVSLAANVVRDLIVGVNLNYIHDYLGVPGSGHPVDLGILKIFRMNAGPDTRREIRVAVSLDNAVSPHIVLNPIAGSEHTEHLPRTLRIGTSYETSWGSRPVRSVELAGLTLIAQIEYRDVLNSLFWEGLSAGLEITYLEVLSLRIGAYSFSLDDYDVPDANRDRLSEFTFGIGATLPLDVLTRSAMPFRLQFDLARMRQPSYSQSMTDWDPFTVVNLSVSTTFK